MSTATSLALAAAVLAACGDDKKLAPDGSVNRDDSNTGGSMDTPPPPALGSQIDRAGRPAITTMLIGTFKSGGLGPTMRDAYNHASDPASWLTLPLASNLTVLSVMETNLAVFDAMDYGVPTTSISGAGCRNALLYTAPDTATSYGRAAELFADDQLYVDTNLASGARYLALEIEFATSGQVAHSDCGGRTPSHDVIDVMYSVLAGGINGLDKAANYGPLLHDTATGATNAHTDVQSAFPFLGPPR